MKSERGVTLIEFMVSIAILATVALTSFYTLTVARQVSESSRYRLLALNVARSALERVKNTALISVPGMSTTGLLPVNPTTGVLPGPLPSGAIAINTNPSVISAATNVATVTVTVSWRGSSNRQEQIQVSTMRSRF